MKERTSVCIGCSPVSGVDLSGAGDGRPRQAQCHPEHHRRPGLRRPFFAYLATNTPHGPDMVPKAAAAPYGRIGTYKGKSVHAAFFNLSWLLDGRKVR